MVSPAVLVLATTNQIDGVVFVIVLSVIVIGYAAILPIRMIADKVSETIAKKKAIAYRLQNQCKGITKKGEQCLNWSDCPHHSN